jgi:hypothetical protein
MGFAEEIELCAQQQFFETSSSFYLSFVGQVLGLLNFVSGKDATLRCARLTPASSGYKGVAPRLFQTVLDGKNAPGLTTLANELAACSRHFRFTF